MDKIEEYENVLYEDSWVEALAPGTYKVGNTPVENRNV